MTPRSRDTSPPRGGCVPRALEPVAPADQDSEASVWGGQAAAAPHGDEALVDAKRRFADAVEDLIEVIRDPEVLGAIGQTDRSNLAKYLTIARIRLDNAIAVVRTGDADR